MPQNVIVRMPNWIGDLVMATPVLSDLRKTFPDAHITAMCKAPICEMLKEDPEIDELYCFHRPSTFSRHSEKRNIIEKLRKGKYDVGILLTRSFSSAWWFWQGRIPRRIGYKGNGRSLLLTDPFSLPKEGHLVVTYKRLLEPMGIPVSKTEPRLYLTKKELEEAKVLLAQQKIPSGARIVGINPGAAYGSAKCWLPERFREVSEKLLQEENIYIVYFGDRAGTALVKEICRDLPNRVVNLAGVTSIRELMALISLCDVLLTNDSGPMHIADALGTQVVALFGSTNNGATGPYRSGRVIRKKVACSPCYLRKCPIDFRCMTQITTDEVFKAIMDALDVQKAAQKDRT